MDATLVLLPDVLAVMVWSNIRIGFGKINRWVLFPEEAIAKKLKSDAASLQKEIPRQTTHDASLSLHKYHRPVDSSLIA